MMSANEYVGERPVKEETIIPQTNTQFLPNTQVPPPMTKDTTTGRWTQEEHQLFLEGLRIHKKQWKQIADLIKTRTVVQIRTHAQKYFQKLMKSNKTGDYDETFLQEFVGTSGLKSPSEDSEGSSHGGDKKVLVKPIRMRTESCSSSTNASSRSNKKLKTLTVQTTKNCSGPTSPKPVSQPPSAVQPTYYAGHIPAAVYDDFGANCVDWFPSDHYSSLLVDHHHVHASLTNHTFHQHESNHMYDYTFPSHARMEETFVNRFDELELAWLAEITNDQHHQPHLHYPQSQTQSQQLSQTQNMLNNSSYKAITNHSITPADLNRLGVQDRSTNDSPRSREDSIATSSESDELDEIPNRSNVKSMVTSSSLSNGGAIPNTTQSSQLSSQFQGSSFRTKSLAPTRKRGRPRRSVSVDDIDNIASNTKITSMTQGPSSCGDVYPPIHHHFAFGNNGSSSYHNTTWDDDEDLGGLLLDAFA